MKKRFLVIVVLLVVLIGSCSIIIGIATGLFGSNSKANRLVSNETISNNYIEYVVNQGDFEDIASLEGYVLYGDEANVVIEEKVPADTQILCKVGDQVEKDSVLYSYSDKQVNSTVNGIVTGCSIDNNTIYLTLTDFSKTRIQLSVPEKYQDKLTSSSIIEGTYGSQTEQLYIDKTIPEIQEGSYQVILNNPFNVFNNTTIKIKMNFETRSNVVIINKECVKFTSEDKAYINILDENNNVTKTVIELGSENDGFYEIIGGEELVGKTVVVDKEELMIGE